MVESQSMKPDNKSSKKSEGSKTPSGTKTGWPLWDRMVRLGLPLTREQYLALDRDDPSVKLSAEEEANLPPQLRKNKE
jgi:hypothetical protein